MQAMPKIVYHGTFWPVGSGLGPDGLKAEPSYVSTTPVYKWAAAFARQKRRKYSDLPGKLVVYKIDTGRISEDMRNTCIPPDGLDPRPEFLAHDERLREDRIEIKDWRFWHIPAGAIVGSQDVV